MPRARLDALHTLLAGFVARPEPGVLVIACADCEVLYLLHTLATLDRDSPADRFHTVAAAFTDLPTYLTNISESLPAHLSPANLAPATVITPQLAARHLTALWTKLLADLPAGDHRLVCALTPVEIADPTTFAALTTALLTTPHDPRLRLLLRDDALKPHTFDAAATCPSEQVLAYRFSLPPARFIADLHATASDSQRPPDQHAQALLQLAGHDLHHRRHADAIARCDLAATLAVTPTLQSLALALKADALRHSGDFEAALTLGRVALQRAAAVDAFPVVVHAALALGDLTRSLGHRREAIACFHAAERAAAHNHRIADHARAARVALEEPSC